MWLNYGVRTACDYLLVGVILTYKNKYETIFITREIMNVSVSCTVPFCVLARIFVPI